MELFLIIYKIIRRRKSVYCFFFETVGTFFIAFLANLHHCRSPPKTHAVSMTRLFGGIKNEKTCQKKIFYKKLRYNSR